MLTKHELQKIGKLQKMHSETANLLSEFLWAYDGGDTKAMKRVARRYRSLAARGCPIAVDVWAILGVICQGK